MTAVVAARARSRCAFAAVLFAAGIHGATAQPPRGFTPLFEGTPRPISKPNLEKQRSGPRPPLMVPAGTVLLSQGKPGPSSAEMLATAVPAYPMVGG